MTVCRECVTKGKKEYVLALATLPVGPNGLPQRIALAGYIYWRAKGAIMAVYIGENKRPERARGHINAPRMRIIRGGEGKLIRLRLHLFAHFIAQKVDRLAARAGFIMPIGPAIASLCILDGRAHFVD